MPTEHSSTPPQSPSGFVYLFRAGRFYKIGMSADPGQRKKAFAGFPMPVKLVHQIVTDSPSWLESHLHHRFRRKRLRGEWFRLAKADVEEICAVRRMDYPFVAGTPGARAKGRRRASFGASGESRRVPGLCRHKGSNLAYATDPDIDREVYFGPWGTAESQAAYLAWAEGFRMRSPDHSTPAPDPTSPAGEREAWRHLEGWVRQWVAKPNLPAMEKVMAVLGHLDLIRTVHILSRSEQEK